MGERPTRPDAPPQAPSLVGAPWLADPTTRAVFKAIGAEGAGVRAVGGAVRNALLCIPVTDIDLATTAPPQEVMRLVRKAGLEAVPTGLEHGTVTVVAAQVPFEVTTLRRDVETHGRHAVVSFTNDWAEDARRRDFTMNALYCDADGSVHDPLGGYADLAARRVRFIGKAEDRIREDYLRILRFFRLTAQYGEGPADAEGLAAAVALHNRLERLSGERLRTEMVKLLVAPRAAEIAALMHANEVLFSVIRHRSDPQLLRRICEIEQALQRPADPMLRLAALATRNLLDAERLADRLRLSTREATRLAQATHSDPAIDPMHPERAARAVLYRVGREAYQSAVLRAWASTDADAKSTKWRDRLTLPERWPPPQLPFSGRDVLGLGIAAGPRVGRILAAFERWWIDNDFPLGDDIRTHEALERAAAATQ